MGKSPRPDQANAPRKSPRIIGGGTCKSPRRSPRLAIQPLFASVALIDRHTQGGSDPQAEMTGGFPVFNSDCQLPRKVPLQQKFVRKHTNMATKVWDPDNFVPQGGPEWAPRLPRYSVKKADENQEMPPPFSTDQPVTVPKRSVSFKRAAAEADDTDDDSFRRESPQVGQVKTDPTGRKGVHILAQPTASVPLWSRRM